MRECTKRSDEFTVESLWKGLTGVNFGLGRTWGVPGVREGRNHNERSLVVVVQ